MRRPSRGQRVRSSRVTGHDGLAGPTGSTGAKVQRAQQGPAGTPGTVINCPTPDPTGKCYGIIRATNADGSITLAVNSVIFPRLQSIASHNGTNRYTGGGNPAWNSYTQYPVFIFTPDVSCFAGNNSLNVDSLGDLVLQVNKNGVLQNAGAGDCLAGQPYVVIPLPAAPGVVNGVVGGAVAFVIYQ